MKYEEFVGKLSQKIDSGEIGDPGYEVTLLREGYTSDDPEMLKLIRDCNMRYSGINSDTLVTEFIVKKSKTSGEVQLISVKQIFKETNHDSMAEIFTYLVLSRADAFSSDKDEETKKANFEKLKKNLIIRPLNYALHSNDLRGCVFQKIGDIALVLYQYLGKPKGSISTSKIKNSEIDEWGMRGREEEIMNDALLNTARLFPASVFNYRTNTEVDLLRAEFTKEDLIFHGIGGDMILVSTFQSVNGAVALFYPGVVEKMMKVMRGPFNAVFMNINDIIIFDKNDKRVNDFRKTGSQSSMMGEKLSNYIYRCDEKGIRKL